jgi:SAM-dependent methyltransferase
VKKFENNPFEDEVVAAEWIVGVESEKGQIRDNEIYPCLKSWSASVTGTVVDIGAGQGVASTHVSSNLEYIGIEPSPALVQRAKELYTAPQRKFVVGNAYSLPIENGSAGGCFSINVWFHLTDLDTAAREVARVLKPGGTFLIITANPSAYEIWEDMYTDIERDGNMIIGKVKLLTNTLSKNTFYEHPRAAILDSLANAGLQVTEIGSLGRLKNDAEDIFISITGHK